MTDLLLRRRNLLNSKQENIRAVCFEADQEQTVEIIKAEDAPDITMQYSYDGITWDAWDLSALPFGGDTKIYVRGIGNKPWVDSTGNSNHFSFGTDAYVYVSGIVESLLDGENEVLTIQNDYSLYGLFYYQTALRSAINLRFEAISIKASNVYSHMFSDCSNLLYAPKMLSVNDFSGDRECSSMFSRCTSLITAPELPATTLSGSCYNSMFYGCTSLVNAPALPATTLSNYCYSYMFNGCTNLINAPALPATTLSNYCYSNMFYGCTSLVNAPELPATTLTENCYYSMFRNCSSLVNAPELPATTLAKQCYQYMFYGCTSLKTIRCRAKVTASSATVYWLYGVSSSGAFYGHSEYGWPSGVSGIPSGWEFVELTD